MLGVAITTINLVGYSAMAGIVGGGDWEPWLIITDTSVNEDLVMWVTVIVLIAFVQCVQMAGDKWAAKITNQRR